MRSLDISALLKLYWGEMKNFNFQRSNSDTFEDIAFKHIKTKWFGCQNNSEI